MPEVKGGELQDNGKPVIPKSRDNLPAFAKDVDVYLMQWCGKKADQISGGPDIAAEWKAGTSSIMVAKLFRKAYVRSKRKQEIKSGSGFGPKLG